MVKSSIFHFELRSTSLGEFKNWVYMGTNMIKHKSLELYPIGEMSGDSEQPEQRQQENEPCTNSLSTGAIQSSSGKTTSDA